jgi:hypothetical protein
VIADFPIILKIFLSKINVLFQMVMKIQAKFSVFTALVLFFIPQVSSAYFYQQGIASTGTYTTVIKIDKANYSAGEPIVVSGQVEPYDKARELQVTIMDSSKKILVFQTVVVNSDASFSFTVTDTEKWRKDTYVVLAQYGTSDVEVGKASFSFEPAIPESNPESNPSTIIPIWIKNNAGWWAEGTISDSDFVQGLQYLINQGIIKIPQTAQGAKSDQEIPSWIKNNAKWWAEGTISDNDFIQGIQFLIKSGIMIIERR